MGSLLIIDDDVELCELLGSYLTRRGYCISVQHDLEAGLHAIKEGVFDLVVLELMLAGRDGLKILRKLRETSHLGIIVLSDRASAEDRADGFEAGADDYLAKPCDPRELLGRIRAILRRSSGSMNSAAPGRVRRGQAGEFHLNSATCQVHYMGSASRLTEIEFQLLRTLVESAGTVMKREQLATTVFRRELHPLDRRLDMHISRLRRKLDIIGCATDPIRTIRSSGYLFSSPEAEVDSSGPIRPCQ